MSEKGNFVFLCTGRNYAMLLPLLCYPFDGFIGSAGAYVVYRDQILCDRPMSAEQTNHAVKLLKEHNIFYTLDCKEGSYTDGRFKLFLRQHMDEYGNREMLQRREQNEKSFHIYPDTEYDEEPVYKISVVSTARAPMLKVRKALGDAYHFWIHDTGKCSITNGELMRSDVDKGTGILEICKYLEIPLDQTIAFGDSMNDVEMIKAAGFGICMGNGNRFLKELADDVCGTVEQNGLAIAFKKYGFI